MAAAREQQVLDLIREDPMMSQQAMAERLGISRSAVAGHIMKLTSKGTILGRSYVLNDAPFIAVVGGANMDIHGRPRRPLRMHDSNPGTVHSSPGGVARNIAENLARLGTVCRLVSAVGNDQHGNILLQHGRDAGVDMRHVQTIDGAQTSTYLSMLDESGDMHAAINDMTIIEQLGPKRLQTSETMLRQAALVIIDLNLPEDGLSWLTSTLSGQTFFVDTVSAVKAKKIRPFLGAVHTLKTNLIEAESLTGMKTQTAAERKKLAGWIHSNGVRRLFITMGNRGMFFSDGERQGIERAVGGKTRIRNAGGAGDAVLAGLAHAWLQEWRLEKSLGFAMAAARVTLADDATSNPALSLAAIRRIEEARGAS